MERILIAGLIATNLATGLTAFYYYDMHKVATANQTSDREREEFGWQCTSWLNEETKEREIELVLGRSWKKHGQLVFEIMPDHDIDREKVREKVSPSELPAILCTYDKQSGLMHAITGKEREKWTFY